MNIQQIMWYYLTDHLGSTRAVVDDAGNVLETFDYYPFGLLIPKRNTASANTTEKFSGKELDENINQYYFGARYYDPALGRFFVTDRFAETYPSLTPYQYAANNPMNLIDVNGDSVQAITLEAQRMILNTLPKDVRENVVFSSDGFIDRSVMGKTSSESGNFAALKQLVDDDRLFKVEVASGFTHKEGKEIFGDITMGDPSEAGPFSPQTGEQGWFGITLTPGEDGGFNSPGDYVGIVINKALSEKGRAQTFSHEGYGHAYLFSIGKNPNHVVKNVNGVFKETNKELAKQIIRSIQETIINMRD